MNLIKYDKDGRNWIVVYVLSKLFSNLNLMMYICFQGYSNKIQNTVGIVQIQFIHSKGHFFYFEAIYNSPHPYVCMYLQDP